MPEREIDKKLFEPAVFDEGVHEKIEGPSIGFWSDAFRRLFKNKGAIVGLILIVVFIFFSLFGPMMNDFGADKQNIMARNLPPKIPVLEKVSWLGLDGTREGVDLYETRQIEENYWFGTDEFGRDQWTRIWEGTRISLLIAFVAAFIDVIVGVAYGGISGFYGGRVDNIMQRIIEILVGIPNLIIIILLIIVLKPGISSIILAMVITGWVGMARIVRGQILKAKNDEYVLASRTLGSSSGRLILKHLIPNVLGQIIITTMFTIPGAIFFEAFLSFIGLGIQPPEASLGSLVNDGYKKMQMFPHLLMVPAVIISLLMISFNLLGDGLRDAFDPKMKK
ncbi:oligopeptide ABC transporter permease [Aquibacillus kalidii]|uniref:oligopeptide ABC transporter permease n=1 Tax=Aquibacillus kalidii TaxID=2762597 RepID=UPI001644DDA6|nr:oligopeptide ABC transporter permease [Aquibacillus kalidii]